MARDVKYRKRRCCSACVSKSTSTKISTVSSPAYTSTLTGASSKSTSWRRPFFPRRERHGAGLRWCLEEWSLIVGVVVLLIVLGVILYGVIKTVTDVASTTSTSRPKRRSRTVPDRLPRPANPLDDAACRYNSVPTCTTPCSTQFSMAPEIKSFLLIVAEVSQNLVRKSRMI